jgi:hypothetical protein
MTTKEVAAQFDALAKTGKWNEIQSSLYSQDCISIEPPHSQGLQTVHGLDAIIEKGKHFNSMIKEMHGGYCTDPVVADSFFTVAMGMDVTMMDGNRINMDEVCVYEVKEGKIIKEQFFYSGA